MCLSCVYMCLYALINLIKYAGFHEEAGRRKEWGSDAKSLFFLLFCCSFLLLLSCLFFFLYISCHKPTGECIWTRDKLYVQIRICVNMYGYILPQYHLEGERIKKQQFSFAHVLPKNLATILHYNVLKTTRLTVF